jgi:hypothetical protein
MRLLAEDVARAFTDPVEAAMAAAAENSEEAAHDRFMAQRFPHVRAAIAASSPDEARRKAAERQAQTTAREGDAGPAATIAPSSAQTVVHDMTDPNATHRRLLRMARESAPRQLRR